MPLPVPTAERQAELDEIAPQLAATLLIADQWMVRNAETVRLVDTNVVRRRFHRHFLLPPREVRAELDGGVVLPIFFLRKQNFVNCHVRDSGSSVRSLLSAADGNYLIAAVLIWMAETVLQDSDLPPELIRRLGSVPAHGAGTSYQILSPLADSTEGRTMELLNGSKQFVAMVEAACEGYLLFAVVDRRAARQVVALDLEHRLSHPRTPGKTRAKRVWYFWCQLIGWMPYRFNLDMGPDHVAVPNHVELEAPDGITFGRRILAFPDQPRLIHRKKGTNSRRARYRFDRRPGGKSEYVGVDVHPGDTALLRGWIAGVAVTAILAALAIVYWNGGLTNKAATSLLLLIPGAVPLLVVAHGEHPYVTQVVRGLRYCVILLAVYMAAATGIVVLISSKQVQLIAIAITALGGLAAVSTLILLLTYLRGRPSYESVEFVDVDLNRIA
jgi:hypothetical protein